MIDSKDLMQGNLVIYEDKVYAVDKICSIYIDLDSLGVGSSPSIDPIPVTPELLERIGFERDKELMAMRSEVMAYHYRTDDYRLDVDNTFSNFLGDRDWHIHIDNADACSIGSGCFGYLHELQNLVRVITGHDLPISKKMLID